MSISRSATAFLQILLISLPAVPSAAGDGLRVKKEIDLSQRTASPTFYASSKPRLMAAGRLLYLGHGMWQEQDRFEMLDLQSLERLVLRAPLAAFIARRQDLFPGAKGTGHPLALTDRLLYYDPAHGRAGILFEDGYGHGQGRIFCLHWDLLHDRIDAAVELAREPSKEKWLDVRPIGYLPDTGTLYCQVRLGHMDRGIEAEAVTIVAVRENHLRKVAAFSSTRKIFPGPFFDPVHRQALITQYADLPLSGPEPEGFLVHLDSGQVDRLTIPETCYAAAFSKDGRSLYAYSNQRGKLWSIALPQGTYSKPLNLGDHGHALGWVGDDTLLLIRSEGLWTLGPDLKKRRFWPMRQVAPGPFLVERSLITPGRALIVDGQRLFVVDLPR